MTTAEFEHIIDRTTAALGIGQPAKIGVALSGGADSVALLSAYVRLGYDVTALHCDFRFAETRATATVISARRQPRDSAQSYAR